MRSPVALLLKERTSHVHERVDAGLDLLDPALGPDRLAAVVARLLGFWAGTEPAVEAWAARRPQSAAALDWPRRRRSPLLRADLDALGGPATVSVAPCCLPSGGDTSGGRTDGADAAVFGWLYVTEGSTLGGAVIDRALRGAGYPVVPRFFTPYPEGPGPMWRAFCASLTDWADAGPGRAEAAAQAAVRTFTSLEDWLAPVLVPARPAGTAAHSAGTAARAAGSAARPAGNADRDDVAEAIA